LPVLLALEPVLRSLVAASLPCRPFASFRTKRRSALPLY